MYFATTFNGKYASAAESSRDKEDPKKTHTASTYLGRVIDLERGIFESRERGVFTFNLETREYGTPPESYVPPEDVRKRNRTPVCADFGDAYFVNAFLIKSGLMEAIDSIAYGNKDTLHAMILFYTLSNLANYNAITWYTSSITRLIYPNANITSQRISDFLAAVGTPENQLAFQKAYLQFVVNRYSPDTNILIDSTGLPNAINGSMTEYSDHNGKPIREIRLIFVVQRSTGLPLFYKAIPGNIVDITTLERTLAHINALGIDISSCIMDAGYNSGENLDLFYNEDHTCKIGFITRVGARDKNLTKMIQDNHGSIQKQENLVKYGKRYLYIIHKQIMVGSKNNNPAWIYLGLDIDRKSNEQHKLMKDAEKYKMTTEDVYKAMLTQGYFGIISGTEYSNEEILPAYYQRQTAEQIFDIAKNYTKLLPLRTNNDATFSGHLLMSYIATCIVKMIQIKLKEGNLLLGSRMDYLHNQKCIVYESKIVTETPQKEANETYKAFGITCPSVLLIKNGKLQYEISTDPISPQKKKRKVGQKEVLPENASQEQQQSGVPQTSKKEQPLEPEAKNADPQQQKRGRGRPKGSKNKKTLEREARLEAARQGQSSDAEFMMPDLLQTWPAQPQQQKRGRGRPKGSKNKKTLEREAQLATAQQAQSPDAEFMMPDLLQTWPAQPQQQRRGRGRPKGSKNKKTLEREAREAKFKARHERRGSANSKGDSKGTTCETQGGVATTTDSEGRYSVQDQEVQRRSTSLAIGSGSKTSVEEPHLNANPTDYSGNG